MIGELDGKPKENLLQGGAKMEEVRSLGAFLWWIYETLTIFLPLCFSAAVRGAVCAVFLWVLTMEPPS